MRRFLSWPTRWRRCLPLALLALVAWPACAVDAPELKVAIVYNVLQFVEWPEDAELARAGRLVLCVDTTGQLTPVFRSLTGRPVQQRPLEVVGIGEGPDFFKGCHAVYLDATGRRGAALAARLPRSAPLLVIGDLADGQPEAMVQLFETGGRVAFNVDLAAARRSRLQVSSRLLKLAKRVSE
jgi:hypothetical protein